jgi:hypothetical protein
VLAVAALASSFSCTSPPKAEAPPTPERAAPAPVPAENREVVALMDAFVRSGLSLERNGETLDNVKATEWLRSKLRHRASDVLTAEDFLVRVVDHSSETKKPYLVILPDGTKQPSSEWFGARLKEIRAH